MLFVVRRCYVSWNSKLHHWKLLIQGIFHMYMKYMLGGLHFPFVSLFIVAEMHSVHTCAGRYFSQSSSWVADPMGVKMSFQCIQSTYIFFTSIFLYLSAQVTPETIHVSFIKVVLLSPVFQRKIPSFSLPRSYVTSRCQKNQ